MLRRFKFLHHVLLAGLLSASVVLVLAVLAGTRVPAAHAQSTARTVPMSYASTEECTAEICTFELQVNPGLLSGSFACPAIQHAHATITIINRFALDAQNDVMILTARGLPKNTGFDMFLVQNSPLDSGTFHGFGFGWYQSDLQSNASGSASVRVRGIFDKETFIENPADPFDAIHTFNVGFWFNSPEEEQEVCSNQKTPPTTPFNGEQNAGLLAMITAGEPLQTVE